MRLALLEARIRRHVPDAKIEPGDHTVIARVSEWLRKYFQGLEADSSSLPLDAHGQPFERRVWAILTRIPPGTTTTYGAIARALRAPGAARAVGLANGANPIAIVVPCHRVIGASGNLTGYGGGLDRKAWLLNHEREHFFALTGTNAAL
jgi:methylated-DNA-[protein]-cysteine S-methyltransferase